MSWISATDPLALVAIQAGQIGAPATESGASGSSKLDSQQRAVELGEPVPIVFGRRRTVGGVVAGGVLISPGATEARFENDTSNNVTAYYHLVLSEGQIDSIPVKDVFQRSCRVGSHSQTYNRRAGTWMPGNVIVARAGFDMPECPYYCGSVGLYPGMSTLSFSVTIPNGFDQWNRQVHCFIRGGMHLVRLQDAVDGPSDSLADLTQWIWTNSSRVPAGLIDTSALSAADDFLEANGFTCNCWITDSQNVGDLLAKWAPYFLLIESGSGGKKGLRPVLPVNANGTIKTTAITWEYTFDTSTIIPDTFEVQYTSLSDRVPFVAQITWRQQLEDDFGIIRTAEVRYSGTATAGPYESHDLSAFCTTENHAVKVGAYILSKRVNTTHTVRFTARPDAHNRLLTHGDIVRVTMERTANNSAPIFHDYLYQVERITKTLAGDVTYECSHFPVDALGRSVVALDVAAATGAGVLLSSNKTGVGCDINSATDSTIPVETYTTGSDISGGEVVLDGNGSAAPGDATTNSGDGLDGQGASVLPFTVYPSGTTGPAPMGASLGAPNPCSEGTEPGGGTCGVKWFHADQPGGSYQEFINFSDSVHVIGSAEISAHYPSGTYTVRAVWYCSKTGCQAVYEGQVDENASVAPAGKILWYNGTWTHQIVGCFVVTDPWPQYSWRHPAYTTSEANITSSGTHDALWFFNLAGVEGQLASAWVCYPRAFSASYNITEVGYANTNGSGAVKLYDVP